MRQLTALDAQFLHVESATTAAHVAGLAILDASDGRLCRRTLAELLLERLHLAPALNLRLVEVPFGLDHPYWAGDPEFDLDNHLFELTLPAPGGERELAEAVAAIHARRLDRTRPLWEMHLINGLADGKAGVYTKVHHAAIDGVSGAETLAALLDLSPSAVRPAREATVVGLPGGRRSASLPEVPGGRSEVATGKAAPVRPRPALVRDVAYDEAEVAVEDGAAGPAPGRHPVVEHGAAPDENHGRPGDGSGGVARNEDQDRPRDGSAGGAVGGENHGRPGDGSRGVVREMGGGARRVRGEEAPGLFGMLAGAVVHGVMQPARAVRSMVRAAGDLDAIPLAANLPGARLIARAARMVAGDPHDRPPLPGLSAPRTPFNGPISDRRRLAFGSVSWKDVKNVAAANGMSVNDVVMALCTTALRSWLLERDALPDEPLIAAVPVAVRAAGARERVGNQIAALIAPLPTQLADPEERLRAVGQTMNAAKRRFALAPASWLSELCEVLPPAVTGLVTPAIFRFVSVACPPVNLIISNVPGPQFPLYLCGSRVLSYYPMSVLSDATGGVNITCFSYDGMLDFGIVACPERLDDAWGLLAHLRRALDELVEKPDEYREGAVAD